MNRILLNLMLAAVLLVAPPPARADTQPVISPDAEAAFKRLHEHLANSPIEFQTIFDKRGKVYGVERGSARFQIQRPNLFRVEISAGRDHYEVVSDGKAMTIYNQRTGKYASLPAPEAPFRGFSVFAGLTSIEAHVLRFVGMLDEVAAGTQGLLVTKAGSEEVGGRTCDRFTVSEPKGRFSGQWKVWLARAGVPLPCRFAIDRDDQVQTNVFTWKPDPVFAPGTFTFTPPPGAVKVASAGLLGLHPPQ